jgi:ribosome-binding factor A
MSNRRFKRLNELLRRHLSQKLIAEVKDPRVGFVTIIRTDIYDDYTSADVYVTVLEDEKSESTVKALNKMRGFFQSGLSKILGTRLTPTLRFKLDMGAASAVGIDALISKARQSDPDGGDDLSSATSEDSSSESSELSEEINHDGTDEKS